MQVPKLRFKNFINEWEIKTLEEFSEKLKEKNKDYMIKNIISNSATRGLVAQNEYFDREIVNSKNINTYYIINKNDFVYNPRMSKESPFGPINLYNGELPGVISPLYLAFRTVNINVVFLKWFFKSNKWNKYMYLNGDSGARHDRININDSIFFKLPVPLPTDEEQKQIASFFDLIEKRIILQQKKIDLLKEQKKGYMQKIFSQELRFKDVDGKEFPQWKSVKLNNFASKITIKNKDLAIKNVISNSAKNGLISQKDFFDKEIANQENIDGYYVISNGNFVYNPRISNDAPYGPINIYKDTEDGIVSPLYMCFSVKAINKEYLYHYFKGTLWYRYIYMYGDSGARHDRVSIKESTFLEMPILVPSIAEQKLVANFISTLQNKIDIEEKKIESLLNQKQAFMQQMFI